MARQFARRKPIAEINVVPYIDVTLVLLIIFMITAPLLQTGVEVDLPQAEAKTVSQDSDLPIVITIDKDGQYFIDVGGEDDEPVQAQELLIRVAAILRRRPKTKVLLRGDQSVDYGTVVTVMAALKNAGVHGVGLMTSPYEK